MVKKLPKPFQRPGVTLINHGKAWQDVLANSLEAGDIVVDRGEVESILVWGNHAQVHYPHRTSIYAPDDTVRAFTRKR